MTNKKTILVVEDEPALSTALEEKLASEHFKILQAQDGEYGLGLAFANHPDLILLDIVMPKVDGMTFLKRLRENDWGQTAKVIILTNLSEPEKSAEAAKAGVVDFLIKADWKLEEVVKKIEERLAE